LLHTSQGAICRGGEEVKGKGRGGEMSHGNSRVKGKTGETVILVFGLRLKITFFERVRKTENRGG